MRNTRLFIILLAIVYSMERSHAQSVEIVDSRSTVSSLGYGAGCPAAAYGEVIWTQIVELEVENSHGHRRKVRIAGVGPDPFYIVISKTRNSTVTQEIGIGCNLYAPALKRIKPRIILDEPFD